MLGVSPVERAVTARSSTRSAGYADCSTNPDTATAVSQDGGDIVVAVGKYPATGTVELDGNISNVRLGRPYRPAPTLPAEREGPVEQDLLASSRRSRGTSPQRFDRSTRTEVETTARDQRYELQNL